MKIIFVDKTLEKLTFNRPLAIRKLGVLRANLFIKRLSFLQQITTLEEARYQPGHFHELVGDRKGQWACDLDQPYRLIFEPTKKPIPTDASGRYIWNEIRIIDIIEITNYHGK